MANVTFDCQWQEAMAELNEQVHIEDHTLGLEEGEEPAPPPEVTPLEAFQHWACLYIKYMQIFRQLESAYDCMVHPQKRIDVKLVLEVVMAELIILKHRLVYWNPPNPDVGAAPFPWEYVNLDDILVDLKLPPETLEVPIPHYFLEDRRAEIRNRNKLVEGYMHLKLPPPHTAFVEEQEGADDGPSLRYSIDEAIEIIQRNERGRQGMQRALLVKELREEERQRRAYNAVSSSEVDPEMAASNIQRLFRGFQSRRQALDERDSELVFIGMRPPPSTSVTKELDKELDAAYKKRKNEQSENAEAYSNALTELHQTVLEEEGPDMREQMMEERRNWFTDELGKGNFPSDLAGFYLMKNPPPEKKEGEEDDDGGKGKGKKGKKGKKDDKKKKGKDKKGKKGKGKKGKGGDDEEEKQEKPPPLTGPTELVTTMHTCVNLYDEVWLDRDESNNFAQKHDVELAKNVVRPNVMEEVREQVDKMLILQLQNLKQQPVVIFLQGIFFFVDWTLCVSQPWPWILIPAHCFSIR